MMCRAEESEIDSSNFVAAEQYGEEFDSDVAVEGMNLQSGEGEGRGGF